MGEINKHLRELKELLEAEGVTIKEPIDVNAKKVMVEKYKDKLSTIDDLQDAFEDLDMDYKGIPAKMFLYSIGDWRIAPGDEYKSKPLAFYVKQLEKDYREGIYKYEDVLEEIQHKTQDIMVNSGVDPKNALGQLIEELGFPTQSFVICQKEEPHLLYFNEL